MNRRDALKAAVASSLTFMQQTSSSLAAIPENTNPEANYHFWNSYSKGWQKMPSQDITGPEHYHHNFLVAPIYTTLKATNFTHRPLTVNKFLFCSEELSFEQYVDRQLTFLARSLPIVLKNKEQLPDAYQEAFEARAKAHFTRTMATIAKMKDLDGAFTIPPNRYLTIPDFFLIVDTPGEF